ncbi:bifunctional diaminohydroxyphosphoribosylaminopyrimidine deaminase/5-amino-6-(5-phosphoribosylamino)uracil reductase RibD [Bacillus tianshenii]|nr:bifunctional diaminohydroxyphosphoribosylaminopyrimidine deaminase/5-amino-6-(5-phosphoribosylamino)uracil reductase RibD [Bacillus tianshenii]
MTDEQYMQLAIQLAEQTQGQTSPNPVVGAVVVKNHRIVGMGAHLKAGEAHAEVHALKMAGDEAKGATIYVTLEPCSHYGKTPPCADLVVESGIRRAVIASTDPNPKVAGSGIAKLERAGVEVTTGVQEKQASDLNRKFFHYIQTKTPYVTLKTAVSLDGKTATVSGESKWITGKEAREDVHRYRHQHDGILVGVETVIKDNPSLTTRLEYGGKSPIRIVLDHALRIPLNAGLIQDKTVPTWVITAAHPPKEKVQKLTQHGVKVLELSQEQIEIEDVLVLLGEEGITSLFVEGGATVHGSFLKAGAFQQVVFYIAPKLIGGLGAPAAFLGEGIANLQDAPELTFQTVEQVGEDLKIVAVLKEA